MRQANTHNKEEKPHKESLLFCCRLIVNWIDQLPDRTDHHRQTLLVIYRYIEKIRRTREGYQRKKGRKDGRKENRLTLLTKRRETSSSFQSIPIQLSLSD